MNKPTIIINGKEIEMPRMKAKLWSTVSKLVEDSKGKMKDDTVEKYCEVIAVAFGVEKEEVVENLYLDEVLPKYTEVLETLTDMLYANFNKKNETAEATEQA